MCCQQGEVGHLHSRRASRSIPSRLSLVLQRELQMFLAAEASSKVLFALLPPSFLAERSNEMHTQLEGAALPTWRVLLAATLTVSW